MLRALFILALLPMTMPAQAALPPHYQRQSEFMAVIAAAVETFGISHPIDAIVMTGTDLFEVRGDGCRMEARIVTVPPEPGSAPMAGPRRFRVEAGPLVCDP